MTGMGINNPENDADARFRIAEKARLEVLIRSLQNRINELETAAAEYIELVRNESSGMVGIAYAHGWRGDSVSEKRGEELRAILAPKLGRGKDG